MSGRPYHMLLQQSRREVINACTNVSQSFWLRFLRNLKMLRIASQADLHLLFTCDVSFRWLSTPSSRARQWRRQGGGEGGRPPPNVFQSVVLDSFKSDELRRGGWKIVSRQCCVSCVHLFIKSTDLCSNIKLYVTTFTFFSKCLHNAWNAVSEAQNSKYFSGGACPWTP